MNVNFLILKTIFINVVFTINLILISLMDITHGGSQWPLERNAFNYCIKYLNAHDKVKFYRRIPKNVV